MKAVTCIIVLFGIYTPAFAHPVPEDDLLRPKVIILSRSPMSILVKLQPRDNMLGVLVETPNNSTGRFVQCALGSLVKDQFYECRVNGSVESHEPAFTVTVNGFTVESDGHRHLSSRSFSISNPRFDLEEFRSERRQEVQGSRAAGKTERVLINKK